MPGVAGPYSPSVRAGPWLVVSGQLGIKDGALVAGGVGAQARQALANLEEILAGAGASLADLVKTTLFLVDIADLGEVNEVYAAALGHRVPARSAVAVAALPLGARFEVEAWAYLPAGEDG